MVVVFKENENENENECPTTNDVLSFSRKNQLFLERKKVYLSPFFENSHCSSLFTSQSQFNISPPFSITIFLLVSERS